jgi:ABC-type polysaccharide/polyol phosphate export permease
MLHQIKAFLYFLNMIYQQRYVIKKLVIQDFKKKYLASYLGLIWAFIQPASIIIVLWFVVTIGLRGGNLESGLPFLPWFIAGMVPWFFVRDGIANSSNSLIEYSFLIKKMYFRVGMIPLIKIFTTFLTHLFLVLILICFAVGFGFYPTLYWLQLPYYLLCALFILIGIGWLTSSLIVFVRDVKQTIDILLLLLFWLTPILWPPERLSGKVSYLVTLNPFAYIVTGYRNTFINKEWFFNDLGVTFYFWSVTIAFFVIGALVFHRLKPHFSDVL